MGIEIFKWGVGQGGSMVWGLTEEAPVCLVVGLRVSGGSRQIVIGACRDYEAS